MNTLSLQVTFDCADPHALARFWAGVLGTEVDDHDEFIGTMLDAGHAGTSDVVIVDGRRAWAEAASCTDPQGRYPRMLFMVVPEGKTAKNRMHLDLHLDGGHTDEAACRRGRPYHGTRRDQAVRRAARPAGVGHDGRPEGNEFCVG